MTENSMFTEVQEESAGVDQSTEGAGDLTSYQPHWVSRIWPPEPLCLITPDLVLLRRVCLFIPCQGQSCLLNGFGSPELQTVPFWLFFPSSLPAADWMLLASLGPFLGSSACSFEWETFP